MKILPKNTRVGLMFPLRTKSNIIGESHPTIKSRTDKSCIITSHIGEANWKSGEMTEFDSWVPYQGYTIFFRKENLIEI